MSQQVITLPSAAQPARPRSIPKTVTPASEPPPLRPELEGFLDQVVSGLEPLGVTFVRASHGISFERPQGLTAISVEPVDIETADYGRITEIIRVRTALRLPADAALTDRHMCTFNGYAVAGALVRDPRTRQPVIESRLTHYRNADEYLPVYVDLACAAAAFHADGFVTGSRLAAGQPALRYEGMSGFAGPSRWSWPDLDAAAGELRARRLVVERTHYGLAAELPWLPAGEAAEGAAPTCRLRLSVADRHPALGSGLLAMLELPGKVDGRRLPALVHRLNRRDLDGCHLPPMVGAWAAWPRTRGVIYITFWPNLMYRPTLAYNIALWLQTRADIARTWLANGEV